jgi:drug/metabolite transporter (DMT)-like permease
MHKPAIAATTAALLALFLVALPASADTEHVGVEPSIDWPLVVILTVLALGGFYYLLNRGN